MTTIPVLVADDEPAIRQDITEALDRAPGFEVVASCRDGAEALAALDRGLAQVAFLDVRMPELDGLEVVEALDPERVPHVVFVTAFDEYAVKAFDLNAVDYLLKPFDDERFAETLDRVRNRIGQAPPDVQGVLESLPGRRPLERIVVKDRGRIRLIDVHAVRFLEAAGNYVKVHTAHGTHLVRYRLSALADRLDPSRFARIHRSTIVALGHIAELSPTPAGDHQVVLDDGTRLTLSRSFRAGFEAQVGWGL